MHHDLFLTTRQTTKARNAFAKNRSSDIKLSRAQSSKFLGKKLGNLGKKVLLNLAVPFTKDDLPRLAIKTTLSVLVKFKRKNKWKMRCKNRTFTLFFSNEDMDGNRRVIRKIRHIN